MKKLSLVFNIVWYVSWIYYIVFVSSEKSLFLFISEFAAITSFLVFISAFSRKKLARGILAIILTSVLWNFGFYALSAGTIALLYFWLSLLIKLVQFYFYDNKEKVNIMTDYIKNLIILIIGGIIGLGYLSLIIYFIIKFIDDFLDFFDIKLIKLGK